MKLIPLLLALTACAPTVVDGPSPGAGGSSPEALTTPETTIAAPEPCSDNASPAGCPAPASECYVVSCADYACHQGVILHAACTYDGAPGICVASGAGLPNGAGPRDGVR
jgi:hypothetical protein